MNIKIKERFKSTKNFLFKKRNLKQGLIKTGKFLLCGLGGSLLVKTVPVNAQDTFQDFVQGRFNSESMGNIFLKIGQKQAEKNTALLPLFKKDKALNKYQLACNCVTIIATGLSSTNFAKDARLQKPLYFLAGVATFTSYGIDIMIDRNMGAIDQIIEKFK